MPRERRPADGEEQKPTVAEMMEAYRKGEISLSDDNVMEIANGEFKAVSEGANGSILIPIEGPPKPFVHHHQKMENNEHSHDPYPHQLIFGQKITTKGGIKHFSEDDNHLGNPIAFEDVDTLIEKGYLDGQEQYNDGPPASILSITAGMLDRLGGKWSKDPISANIVGHVDPCAESSSGIRLTGLIATPSTIDGEIDEMFKQEFRVLGDREAANKDEHEVQVGELFEPADELTITDTLCRVKWN